MSAGVGSSESEDAKTMQDTTERHPTDRLDDERRPNRLLDEHPQFAEFINYLAPAMSGLAGLVLVLAYPMIALYASVLVVMLAPSIILHEYGHYRVARRAGLDVREFSIGFGPRLRSWERDGVRWSLKAFPLGGAVEVAGMTVEQAEEEGTPRERAFVYARVWTRVKLVTSGSLINLALAWLGISVASVVLTEEQLPLLVRILIAPLNGFVVLAVFVGAAGKGIAEVFVNWSHSDVSSVFSMPTAMDQGVHQAAETGMPVWCYLVLIFALLNLSLGVFNLLPLFPLDGYHGFVALVDGVRAKAARHKGRVVAPLTKAQLGWFTKSSGFVVAVFAVLVVSKDVMKMF